MAATNLFGNIINTHPFNDGNRRFCRFILAHVLIQKISWRRNIESHLHLQAIVFLHQPVSHFKLFS